MKRMILTTLVAAASSAAVSPLRAQDAVPLRSGQTLEGTLASDSRHTYTVDSGADVFYLGHVNQISVDVVVTVLDPEGETVVRFDSPRRGPERFHFTAEDEGPYVIRVTPFEEQEGDYKCSARNSIPGWESEASGSIEMIYQCKRS